MSKEQAKPLSFRVDGQEHDVTEYMGKHPGGSQVMLDMATEKKDITEYFLALHSEQALAVFKAQPLVDQGPPSLSSREYARLREKVLHLYQPNWLIEFLLVVSFGAVFWVSLSTESVLLAAFCSGVAQTMSCWMGHSMAHSRNRALMRLGTTFAGVVGGLSLSWWSPKHNRHHMFTNSKRYDEDIKHNYNRLLFPLIHLKWRYDSVEEALLRRNYFQLLFIAIHYTLLWQNPLPALLGQLAVGYYFSTVLVGNHEREVTFEGPWGMDFVDHQLITSRDYEYEGPFWLLMMGGMQYQAEHHLFPQIPFYNLPTAKRVLREELAGLKKRVITGPVM